LTNDPSCRIMKLIQFVLWDQTQKRRETPMQRNQSDVHNVFGLVKSQKPFGDLVELEVDLGKGLGVGKFYFDQTVCHKNETTGFCLLIYEAKLRRVGKRDVCHITRCAPFAKGGVVVFEEGKEPHQVRKPRAL